MSPGLGHPKFATADANRQPVIAQPRVGVIAVRRSHVNNPFRATEVRAFEVRATEIRATEIRAAKAHAFERRVPEVRATKEPAMEIDVCEIYASEVRVTEVHGPPNRLLYAQPQRFRFEAEQNLAGVSVLDFEQRHLSLPPTHPLGSGGPDGGADERTVATRYVLVNRSVLFSKIERGGVDMSIDVLVRVAEALRVRPYEILALADSLGGGRHQRSLLTNE